MDCVNRDLRTSGTTEEGWIEENIYHSDPTIKVKDRVAYFFREILYDD